MNASTFPAPSLVARVRDWPWVTLAIGGLAALLYCLPGARELLQYDRAALGAGEWWRVLTNHLVHRNFEHVFWDTAPFVVMGALCEEESRRRLLAALALTGVLAPLSVWLFRPTVPQVGGLSGGAHAVFVLLAISMVRGRAGQGGHGWMLGAVALTVASLAYVGYELATGNTVFGACPPGVALPGPVCHLAGGTSGLLASALVKRAATPSASET